MVHGSLYRKGIGRLRVGMVEDRFRSEGGDGVHPAAPEGGPSSLALWTHLGWREIGRRPEVQHGRPRVVMHKELA